MFIDPNLQELMASSDVINNDSLVIAEWNMNIPGNIKAIGNYRYRPSEAVELLPAQQSVYSIQNNVFDESDGGNFYTDATLADVVIDGGYTDDDVPTTFRSIKQKEQMLYSLEDCFGRFRPRSGINKIRYFSDGYVHFTNQNMARRPRFYMGHRDDKFKYWTSYRTEENVERGIANKTINGVNYIDDASPFVVYNEPVPANRIVIKMQTGVGNIDLGPFSNSSGTVDDPFYGYENQRTPSRWSVQYLQNGIWTEAISFNENTTKANGEPVVDTDGYVELQYSFIVPESYRSSFYLIGELASESLLPNFANVGDAYYVKPYNQSIGKFYVWRDSVTKFASFSPSFAWQLVEDQAANNLSSFVKNLVNPPTYNNSLSGKTEYVEFQEISGLRIVVDAMNKSDSTFDLIEMSPRLVADITDMTETFSVTKSASDLGVSGLPVGQLLASTGSLALFDSEMAFSSLNENSIIKNVLSQNLQVKLYDVIKDGSLEYYVPIKTMYVDGVPESTISSRSLNINLRDLYFYFESLAAPELMIPNASLSYIIATLLDYVGFSNYSMKFIEGQSEPIIPYFFVNSDTSLAQVLEELARSTQSAMFFDEYNNFVVMSKEYLMASEEDRPVDIVLYGGSDSERRGVYKNFTTSIIPANIEDIASQENIVYNDGVIRYSSRYIQKSIKSIQQASNLERDVNWVYKPVELWEVSADPKVRSQNEESSNQSSYSLGAYPLNSDLNDQEPYVSNNTIYNNTIDIGEAVYWISRYNGYLYSNAEVIRFDAVEYSVPGQAENNVWITSVREYQKYFANLPFNGKMYPTGLVRIFAEPEYEVVDGNTRMKDGVITKNGRSQFGTKIAYHSAGLNPYWYDNSNVRGCQMASKHIFSITDADSPASSTEGLNLTVGAAGVNNAVGINSTRNGIMKNFFATNFPKDVNVDRLYSTQTGTLQSSAFIMTGGNFLSTENPLDYLSYVYKPLANNYKHFGTRMRLIGRLENNENSQTPYGSTGYYSGVSGSSAGMACMINPATNNGYYFELVALDTIDVRKLENSSTMFNVVFYKIMRNDDDGSAVPVVLWGALKNVVVDSGDFAGQYRFAGEENPTVNDLAVEYEDLGSTRRFYLYINNKLVQTVDDFNPLPVYNNMALFVRGSTRAMFENIYAVAANYSQNSARSLELPTNSVFTDNEISVSEAFRTYAMSGVVQSTMLSGISPYAEPEYDLYFDEFGTIMREAAYFKVRYDKAYPALYARLTPTFNRIKAYTVSGFMAGPYSAEFLIFNATDTAINLDETSGNYLKIQGVSFTQRSDNELSVDDYYSNRGSLTDPLVRNNEIAISPLTVKEEFNEIKNSRIKHGKKEFSIDGTYIQSQDAANDLMGWIIQKVSKPRLSLGIKIFPNSAIQLGDIVSVDYKDNFNKDLVVEASKRFVVYNIEYNKTPSGPDMTIYLSEVV